MMKRPIWTYSAIGTRASACGSNWSIWAGNVDQSGNQTGDFDSFDVGFG